MASTLMTGNVLHLGLLQVMSCTQRTMSLTTGPMKSHVPHKQDKAYYMLHVLSRTDTKMSLSPYDKSYLVHPGQCLVHPGLWQFGCVHVQHTRTMFITPRLMSSTLRKLSKTPSPILYDAMSSTPNPSMLMPRARRACPAWPGQDGQNSCRLSALQETMLHNNQCLPAGRVGVYQYSH